MEQNRSEIEQINGLAATEPVLEPDFFAEERESLFILCWERTKTFLLEHPLILKRLIIGLLILIAILAGAMIFWPDPSIPQMIVKEKTALPGELKEESTLLTDQFTGISLKTSKPNDLLFDHEQAEESAKLQSFASTSFHYQELLFYLYQYDLIKNLANLTKQDKEILYQTYLDQLSQALGETKTIIKLMEQQETRLLTDFEQIRTSAQTLAKQVPVKIDQRLSLSKLETKLAALTDELKQLRSFKEQLERADQLAYQRLVSSVINQPALLAGISIENIDHDNYNLVKGIKRSTRQIGAASFKNAYTSLTKPSKTGLMGQSKQLQ